MKKRQRVAAIVPAAGTSSRMEGISKILTPVNGLPLIGHTLRALESCAAIDEIIIAAREEDVLPIAGLCRELGLAKVTRVLRGGETRPLSVMIALMETKADIAAVHDGARPCVTPALCEAVVKKAKQTGAALPALPLTDSAKEVKNGIVTLSKDRSALFTVQTPQCFDAGLLRGALAKALQAGLPLTDDSAAVEALPYPVHIVPGETRNLKVTTAEDLLLVSALLRGNAP
ncbi:MAG: 2-C-methyl-D-erythritol 4-phosphate cytidylyltransferase [Oscillospiraceae bacterium]|nr:2-C-methyl-D-erythritol 4-phosphate cytidylyltransferase [Oscillospiraceae bacterium]